MKIAVCISGALRTFPFCAPSIRSFFGEVDYYGLFWTQDRHTLNPLSAETLLPFTAISYPEQPKFPAGIEGLTIDGTNLVLMNPSSRPMFLGMQMAFDLLCEKTGGNFSHYDLVFRCRPDLWFRGKVSDFLGRMREPKVYVPNHSGYSGYCDQFAGGPPHLMKHLFTTFQAINSYGGEKARLNAERILKYWLERHDVAVARLPFEFKIFRPMFVGLQYDEIPRHSVV